MEDPIGRQCLLQLALMLLNAFFSAAEAAAVSLNENRIRKQADEGDAAARRMLAMVESPARFLSTIQVCVTLSGFLASAFAAVGFAPKLAAALGRAGWTFLSPAALQKACVAAVTLALSFLMIVLGELVPKRIAMQHPEKMARLSCRAVGVLAKLFAPMVWLLTVSANGVLRLFGVRADETSGEVTEEEIRMMVDIGGESGAIEQDERAMIENIFEFNNTVASDVMVHRMDVVALHVDEGEKGILEAIRQSGLSRFPVYEDDIDDIIGILNTRVFLLNAQSAHPKPLRQILHKPYLVPQTIPADTLFRNMQKQKVHLAVVVDEYGGMSGIVTMEDLLEEIVGKIYDEFDPSEDEEIVRLRENLWRVKGTIQLEALADELEIPLPEAEEYDTLSGLVFSRFASIPEEGTKPEVTSSGLRIQVERICDHRVETALVWKIDPEQEAGKKDTEEDGRDPA